MSITAYLAAVLQDPVIRAMGLSEEQIVQATGLTPEQVRALGTAS